jgi:hypothetical protein
MSDLAWGDTLCGVKITPEAWDMGVIEFKDGAWAYGPAYADLQRLYVNGMHELMTKLRHAYTPIFPPKGWAGKTDAELWHAVFGAPPAKIGAIGFYPDRYKRAALLEIQCQPAYWSQFHDPGSIGIDTDEAPALILELQNAQVLARRLV